MQRKWSIPEWAMAAGAIIRAAAIRFRDQSTCTCWDAVFLLFLSWVKDGVFFFFLREREREVKFMVPTTSFAFVEILVRLSLWFLRNQVVEHKGHLRKQTEMSTVSSIRRIG